MLFLNMTSSQSSFCDKQVLSKIRNYLQIIGRRIDEIVLEHEEDLYKQDSK